jgi:short-subunit dehydrogenase
MAPNMSSPSFLSIHHHAPYPRISSSFPSLSCKGKTAVVTGGSRGIGRAVFHNFITTGGNVFIIGRSEVSLREAAFELDEAAKAHVGYQVADIGD